MHVERVFAQRMPSHVAATQALPALLGCLGADIQKLCDLTVGSFFQSTIEQQPPVVFIEVIDELQKSLHVLSLHYSGADSGGFPHDGVQSGRTVGSHTEHGFTAGAKTAQTVAEDIAGDTEQPLAKAAAFLASDDSSAITGVVLPVDCGLMAGNIVMSSELTLEKY